MKKKEAAHPWLDGETGNAAAMDTEDDITALILTVNRVERELEANTPLKEFIVTRAREHVEHGLPLARIRGHTLSACARRMVPPQASAL